MEMQTFVIWACLVYSGALLLIFWFIRPTDSTTREEANKVVTQAASQRGSTDSFDVGSVVEKAAKLVEAFGKAGPAIASLGASIVALGFAAYIVAQPPKDETKTGDQNAPQGTTTPPAKKQ